MKTKLILLLMLIGFVVKVSAQDPIPNLIISEIHMNHTEEAYVEITNIGTLPADLSKVVFAAAQNTESYRTDTSRWNVQFLTRAGILNPGESKVVINYRTATADPTNIFTPSWYLGKGYYMLMYTERGSTSGMRFSNGNDAFGLFYDRDGDNNFSTTLDTLIDEVGFPQQEVTFDVAGVTNASVTHAFIRKATVTKGNAGDWVNSAGISSEDSEWIVVPYDPWRLGAMFTTVGIHGNNYTWDFSPKSGTIDENSFTMPWGAWRDSIYKELNFGPNMAWHLRWGADTLESNAVQSGDTLYVYLAGDEVQTKKYPITVTEALQTNNIVIPKLDRNASGGTFTPYAVTNGRPVIDTIFSIGFGTRIDSVFFFLEKATNASWKIITFDGATRAEVKTGDKLEVKAANGDIKEYYILTDEYNPSNNAYLQTILIDNDTLWGFSRNTDVYNITLPLNATRFPSISATPESNDARVTITHPISIRGTQKERTATIQVIAESDTIIFNYSLIFDYPRSVQNNVLEPFFSQVIHGNNSGESGFEIFNPSNVPISLADYVMVRARPDNSSAPISSIQDLLALRDSSQRDFILNFGYYYDNSRKAEGLYFKEASNYNIDIEPFDVWFIKRLNDTHWGGPDNADYYCYKGDQPLYYGYNDGSNVGYYGAAGYNFWLLKMLNPAILDGTISADNPDDWRFVDIYGTVGDRFDNAKTIDGIPLTWDADQHLIRKGNIQHGNPEPYGSLREDNGPGSSEWFVVNGEDYTGPLNDVGRHSGFIKPTNFMSTVNSSTYQVSKGIGNNEQIKGVFPGSTVTAFYANIIKADPGQVLAVRAADGSGARASSATVLAGDTLVVLSADLKNTTKYKITTGFLSTNALLSSDIYTVGFSGLTGTIGVVEQLTTINELLAHLTVPAGAFMNIFDGQRRHIPLLHYTPDTLIAVDPIVNEDVFIEVIAEDGVTKMVYSLIMGDVAEPFLTSNVYFIYQDLKIIDLFILNTNIKTFLYNVTPSAGASIKILDKYDYERTEGNMFIDDRIVVTDQNEVSVIYTLHEFYDLIPVITGNEDRSMEEAGFVQAHNLYPNPANSSLTIEGLEFGSKVLVINLLGDIMEVRESYSGSLEFDLNRYSSGVYFVRIIKDQKSNTYKFIKQ